MARRRMISQDLTIDEHFNMLSMEAQNLFIRMIAVSDDCGVVPCSEYTLNCLTNPPEGMKKNILLYVEEIVKLGLGKLVTYNEKPFFIFKRESFDRYQNYIVNKRVKSEYLRISADEFDSIDFSSFESKCEQMRAVTIESIEYKDISKKIKDKRVKVIECSDFDFEIADKFIERAIANFKSVKPDRDIFAHSVRLLRSDGLTEETIRKITKHLNVRPDIPKNKFCWFDQIGTPEKLRHKTKDGQFKIWEKVLQEIKYKPQTMAEIIAEGF